MTVEEAIEIIKQDKYCQCECVNKNCGSCNIDYSAKEWQTAIEMAVEALEKQIPVKPKNKETFVNDISCGFCPICNEGLNSEFHYCLNCGQKIDWNN